MSPVPIAYRTNDKHARFLPDLQKGTLLLLKLAALGIFLTILSALLTLCATCRLESPPPAARHLNPRRLRRLARRRLWWPRRPPQSNLGGGDESRQGPPAAEVTHDIFFLAAAGGASRLQLDCRHYRLAVLLAEALLGLLKIEGAIDKSDVREGLWIVPQRHVVVRVDFLRKQA
jgi:hypothetical protein